MAKANTITTTSTTVQGVSSPTMRDVARTIGASDVTTRASTTDWYNAYAIADDEGRIALRLEWFTAYLEGVVSATPALQAIQRKNPAYLSTYLSSRGGYSRNLLDADMPGVYDRCKAKFADHVVRDNGAQSGGRKAADAAHTPKAKPTAAELAMVAALVQVCGSRARALEVLNAYKG